MPQMNTAGHRKSHLQINLAHSRILEKGTRVISRYPVASPSMHTAPVASSLGAAPLPKGLSQWQSYKCKGGQLPWGPGQETLRNWVTQMGKGGQKG